MKGNPALKPKNRIAVRADVKAKPTTKPVLYGRLAPCAEPIPLPPAVTIPWSPLAVPMVATADVCPGGRSGKRCDVVETSDSALAEEGDSWLAIAGS